MSTESAMTVSGKPVTLINPEWDKKTPCIPTSVLKASGEANKISLEEAQAHLDKVRHYCIVKSPGFASIAASVKHIVLTPGSNMFSHVAFTDGWSVWYAGGFFKESIKAQAAIVIHEVLHVALRHPQRALKFKSNHGHPYGGKNFDSYMWNIAADCVVNLSTMSLSWVQAPKCGIVKFETTLEEELLKLWPPHRWNLEKLYIQLMKQSEGAGGTKKAVQDLLKKISQAMSDLKGGGDGTPTIDPNSLLGDVVTVLNETRQDSEAEGRNWNSRMERAAAGDAPGGMLRQALFDVPTTNTPWQTILRRWLTANVLPTTEPHVFKPSRAMISRWAFGKKRGHKVHFDPGIQPSKGIKKMAVCVDTSGSITDEILHSFCAEIQTIRGRVGADIVIIPCDAEVGKVIDVARHENLLQKVKNNGGGFGGGGGTDFRPAVKLANEIPGVAVIVYLTDMMGPYPAHSKLPLIWAATHEPSADPPCGRVIRIMED